MRVLASAGARPGRDAGAGARRGRGALRYDGGNLALVLERIQREARDSFTDLVADLAALVPGVRGVRTEFLENRQEYDFAVDFAHTGWVAPASLSDGTLRALALLAVYWDPAGPGLLPVEEIENGMHLGQVAELVRRLGQATGVSAHPPYRQFIATTHSPALLAAWGSDVSGSVVFLEQADHVDPRQGTVSRVTLARPLLADHPEREPGDSMTTRGVARILRRLDLRAS
ncbi:ATP-binding protein [Streptacidiphilus sp. 4-A2]|nr:ATP-binding protein [Streptacidiphilus sp. 4-A2]